MNPRDKVDEMFKVAVAMAPAFRDKFDFADGTMPGEKNQYQRLADMAFASAEALIAEREARLDALAKSKEGTK